MYINFYDKDETDSIELAKNQLPPDVFVDVEETEQSPFGKAVAEVHLVRGNKTAKFFVAVKLNQQGRPQLHIATNIGNKTNTKSMTGSFK